MLLAPASKNCSVCGGVMSEIHGDHNYLESPMVVLAGIHMYRCPQGHSVHGIPSPTKLHTRVVTYFVTKRPRLAAAEVTFLRTQLKWSVEDLASHIGVSVKIAREWETGSRIITVTADRLLRVCVAQTAGFHHIVLGSLREFGNEVGQIQQPVVLSHVGGNWRIITRVSHQ